MRNNYEKTVAVVTSKTGRTVQAKGWFVSLEPGYYRGFVEHPGNPWSVNPADLLPVSPHDGIFSLRITVDDAGSGRTSWEFSFRKADVGPDSIRCSSHDFWDKVSMGRQSHPTTGEEIHTYMGRHVTGITIHLESLPKVVQAPEYNPGGAL